MTADGLRTLGDAIQKLRMDAWCDGDVTVMSPESAEHYLMAQSHLDLALRHVRLATYTLMQKR